MKDRDRKMDFSLINSSIPNINTANPSMKEPKNAKFLGLNLCPTIPNADDVIKPERWTMPNTNPDWRISLIFMNSCFMVLSIFRNATCDILAPLFKASWG